jgi:hypothetical protein
LAAHRESLFFKPAAQIIGIDRALRRKRDSAVTTSNPYGGNKVPSIEENAVVTQGCIRMQAWPGWFRTETSQGTHPVLQFTFSAKCVEHAFPSARVVLWLPNRFAA